MQDGHPHPAGVDRNSAFEIVNRMAICHTEFAIRVHPSQVKSEQDSIGGTVACVCRNVPPALGEPVFDRLEAMMAHAMLSL